MHISGNPVPFDIHNGDAHEEYLVLLHTKSLEYVNRAVRMDRATKRITHVSAGPVLRIQDYRNEVGINLKPCIPGLSRALTIILQC